MAGVEVGVEPVLGMAEAGDLQYDLPDLFTAIGKAAQAAGRGWLFLIDEVQYLSGPDLSAFIVALHRMLQDGLPVRVVGAGLPQIARLAGEANSYSERRFQYPAVGALAPASARQAIDKPIVEEEATIAPEALHVMIDRTKGYPFFLQEWASVAWNNSEGPEITVADVQQSYPETLARLDEGPAFLVRPWGPLSGEHMSRWPRLTSGEWLAIHED